MVLYLVNKLFCVPYLLVFRPVTPPYCTVYPIILDPNNLIIVYLSYRFSNGIPYRISECLGVSLLTRSVYNAQRFNYKIEYARRFHIGVVQLVGQRPVDGQTNVAGLGMFAQTFPLVTGNLRSKNNPQKQYYKMC